MSVKLCLFDYVSFLCASMCCCVYLCVFVCVFVFIFVRVCAWQLPLRPPRDNMEMFPFAPRDISLSISPLPVSYINVKHCSYHHQNLSFETDCTPADFLKLRCLRPELDLDIVLSAPSRFFLPCHSCRDKTTKKTHIPVCTSFSPSFSITFLC